MEIAQTVLGSFLMLLGVVGYLRTRALVHYLVGLSDPPLSQAAKDRISASVFFYHLIAGLTAVSGLLVVLLASSVE
ncbi:MAG TPA: hypothetical protein VLA54_07635 [Acidimicrobiia bacterium]|nr:hypothetical protein [Acidimicrobiia bacterium]